MLTAARSKSMSKPRTKLSKTSTATEHATSSSQLDLADSTDDVTSAHGTATSATSAHGTATELATSGKDPQLERKPGQTSLDDTHPGAGSARGSSNAAEHAMVRADARWDRSRSRDRSPSLRRTWGAVFRTERHGLVVCRDQTCRSVNMNVFAEDLALCCTVCGTFPWLQPARGGRPSFGTALALLSQSPPQMPQASTPSPVSAAQHLPQPADEMVLSVAGSTAEPPEQDELVFCRARTCQSVSMNVFANDLEIHCALCGHVQNPAGVAAQPSNSTDQAQDHNALLQSMHMQRGQCH